MGIRINTNIGALNAQRNIDKVSGNLDKSLERLSSGTRISRASDDASGLGNSVKMQSQIKGLSQAVRNANDGISITQTAEGSLEAITSVLHRLRELAVQATNTGQDREVIQTEASQLVSELTRIGNDTEYQGNILLNGKFTSGKLQIGANFGQSISFSINDVRAAALGARATKTASLDSGLSEGALSVGEFKINDILINGTQESDDQVSVLDLQGSVNVRDISETFSAATLASGFASAGSGFAAGEIVITNGVSDASLGAIAGVSTAASAATAVQSLVSEINSAALSGITATRANGSTLLIVAASGFDFGIKASTGATASSASLASNVVNMFALTSGLVGASNFVIQVNDGSGLAVSGLVINGVSIAAVSLNQGTVGAVSGATTGASTLANMTSNRDEDFLNALITAINNHTASTSVTARSGSGNTLVLIAASGKDLAVTLTSGATTASQAQDYVGLAASYVTSAGTVTNYNGQSGAIAKAAAINAVKATTKVTAAVDTTSIVGSSAISSGTIATGDLYINGVNIGAVSTVTDGDGTGTLVAAINAKSSQTGVTASVDSNKRLVLNASDGRNISVVAKAGASEIGLDSGVYRSSVTLNSNSNFTIKGDTSDFGNISAQEYTTDLSKAVSLIDLSSQSGAEDALKSLDAAIEQVNTVRANLGAIQNRLTTTIANLQSTMENLSAANSRILDADFAMETAQFTKSQVINQAATAMLAQANQLPQLALQLLR